MALPDPDARSPAAMRHVGRDDSRQPTAGSRPPAPEQDGADSSPESAQRPSPARQDRAGRGPIAAGQRSDTSAPSGRTAVAVREQRDVDLLVLAVVARSPRTV